MSGLSSVVDTKNTGYTTFALLVWVGMIKQHVGCYTGLVLLVGSGYCCDGENCRVSGSYGPFVAFGLTVVGFALARVACWVR